MKTFSPPSQESSEAGTASSTSSGGWRRSAYNTRAHHGSLHFTAKELRISAIASRLYRSCEPGISCNHAGLVSLAFSVRICLVEPTFERHLTDGPPI